MMTLEKIVKGLGSAGQNAYKDVYKAAKAAMTDRAMAVRTAAAKVVYSYELKSMFHFKTLSKIKFVFKLMIHSDQKLVL